MVSARHPHRVHALHAVVARQDILQRVVERMSKVQRGGDIWRRNEDRIRRASISGLRMEATSVAPPRPRKGLRVRRGVGFGELEFRAAGWRARFDGLCA